MAKPDHKTRAITIAETIARLVHECGGTSSHVAAAGVVLPASTFDDLYHDLREKLQPEKPLITMEIVEEFILRGVRFARGASDETIRKEAMLRAGLTRAG